MIVRIWHIELGFSPEFLSACCIMDLTGHGAELSTLCGGWEL